MGGTSVFNLLLLAAADTKLDCVGELCQAHGISIAESRLGPFQIEQVLEPG